MVDVEGNIYLVYTPHVPAMVEVVNGVHWVVVVRNDVAILQVPVQYASSVPVLLSRMAGCCGDEKRAFRDATEAEYNKWLE